MSTDKYETITPVQCRMARSALGIGVRDIAKLSGLSAMTITRFENNRTAGNAQTFAALITAFEEQGIEFLSAGAGNGPGVRLAKDPLVEE